MATKRQVGTPVEGGSGGVAVGRLSAACRPGVVLARTDSGTGCWSASERGGRRACGAARGWLRARAAAWGWTPHLPRSGRRRCDSTPRRRRGKKTTACRRTDTASSRCAPDEPPTTTTPRPTRTPCADPWHASSERLIGRQRRADAVQTPCVRRACGGARTADGTGAPAWQAAVVAHAVAVSRRLDTPDASRAPARRDCAGVWRARVSRPPTCRIHGCGIARGAAGEGWPSRGRLAAAPARLPGPALSCCVRVGRDISAGVVWTC